MHWQSDLARELGTTDRTVRRWAAGQVNVPPAQWARIAQLAKERAARLEALGREAEALARKGD